MQDFDWLQLTEIILVHKCFSDFAGTEISEKFLENIFPMGLNLIKSLLGTGFVPILLVGLRTTMSVYVLVVNLYPKLIPVS